MDEPSPKSQATCSVSLMPASDAVPVNDRVCPRTPLLAPPSDPVGAALATVTFIVLCEGCGHCVPSSTVRVTVYTPSFAYMCVGFTPLPCEPSPKSHE